MSPLSAAERQRRCRARRNADSERRQKYLESERQRWRRDVERGTKKRIHDLSERAKRQQRKKWREHKRRDKEKAEALKNFFTPPQSPDSDAQREQQSRQQEAGKRLARKNKDRLHKEIERLQTQLKKERKRADKYRKRFKRITQGTSPQSKVKNLTRTGRVNPNIQKTLLFHEALIADIKNKYQNTRRQKEKQLISKITVGKIIRKYRLQGFAEKELGFSHRHRRIPESRNFFEICRRPANSFAAKLKSKVKDFFTRDDVSRVTTGRKQTLTRNKVKKQKRLLVDTMKTLHKKFLAENNCKLSYSLFCQLRPFFVVHPTVSDRNTCLCKIHENLKFIADKLHNLKLIETSDLESLTKTVSCNILSKACMYGECVECKDKTVKITNYDGTAKVEFTQWVMAEKERDTKSDGPATVKITIKKTIEDSQNNMVELFHTMLHKYKRHMFNICHQYEYCRQLKRNMSTNEALIHIDFSENYMCKYSSEVQAVHFGSCHQQATLHTGVFYIGGKEEPVCFCSVSPSRHKGPPAIWEHLNPVLDHIQATHPTISTLHFFSDGPCTQYKQKGNFFLFSTELARRGLTGGTWNYFEAGHGKGAPDGVGGTLKRMADSWVCKGHDIPNAEALYKALSETSTSVKLFYVDNEAVEKAIQKMPDQIPPVPATMKIHQVVTVTSGEILYREVSCMCSTQKQLKCQCFTTQYFSFNKKPSNVAAGISWDRNDMIGQWCVLKYDNDLYPGIILNKDETHVQVKCMHRVGNNRFFWPSREDILWYLFDDVLQLIEEPQPVTSRHVEIQRDVWNQLSRTLEE